VLRRRNNRRAREPTRCWAALLSGSISPELRGAARRLAGFPRILAALRGCGVALGPGSGEDLATYEARLESRLMVLFRETGDERAFEALYETSRGSLLTWITGFLRVRRVQADATEFLQDAFVNVYRYAHSFRHEHGHSFRVWVRTIAGNVIRRRLMGQSRASLQALPEGLQEPADGRDGPERLAERSEQGRSMRRAWAILLVAYAEAWEQLSERDRHALHLVEVEGKSYARAGAELGVRLSNMKMIIFRARKRVRDRIRLALGFVRAAEEPCATRRAG